MPAPQDVWKKGIKILKLPSVRNCFTLAMTNKLVVIINSLIVPKIKKILLYEMKFLVPNYSCLQNSWLGGGYRPQIPVPSVLYPQLNLLNHPPPNKIPGYATGSVGTGASLPGGKAIGTFSLPHLYLVAKSGTSAAIIPFPQTTSRSVQRRFYAHFQPNRSNSGVEQWHSFQFLNTTHYIVCYCPGLSIWLSVVSELLWRNMTQWPASNIFTGNETCCCCRNKGNSWW